MSSAMNMSTDSGCSCGGSCGGGHDCGCGGSSQGPQAAGRSPAVCTDQSFRQPRFFPNQLLTHDSLQGLVDYVVGKNRLHNRFLFGDGVVCGLTVTCHPCGDGKITVAPGYALDCCGNDILLPCAEDLDIKALVRDLRKRQMAGHDCGDPCEKGEDGVESYGLYLVYDETPVDPVAPYNSGEPCGQQSCEPSQICEGYRFELRCDCDGPDRVDVFDRIRACIGDLRQAATMFAKAQTAQNQSQRLLQASQVVASEAEIAFTAESVSALRRETPALERLNALSIDEVDDAGNPIAVPQEQDLRLNIAQAQLLTGAITRFRALPAKQQELLLSEEQELGGLIENAQSVLREAAPRISFFAPKALASNAARIEADETIRLAQRFALDDDAGDERYISSEARFISLNTPVTTRQAVLMQTEAAQVKAWLLDKLANSTTLTRCDLYDRAKRIRLDAVPGTDAAGINVSSQAVADLIAILLEYLIDCICLALNPPCRPCDDKGVLLACLKVKDCEVIDICNLSRSFVLSPVAMRYWLPPIGFIGDLFKRLCCDFDLRKFGRREQNPPQQDIPQFVTTQAASMPIASSYAPVVAEAELDETAQAVLKQFKIAPADVGTLSAFASNLGLLSSRAVNLDLPSLSMRGNKAIETILGAAPVADIAAPPQLESQIRDVVTTEVTLARNDAQRTLEAVLDERLSGSLTALRGDVETEVESTVSKSLEKTLTAKMPDVVTRSLRSAPFREAVKNNTTVKNLLAENRKLNADMKKMAATLARLEKGMQS